MNKTNRFPIVMKSTAAITSIATILLTIAYHFLGWGWLLSAAITAGTFAYHFLMRLAVGAVVPKLARNCRRDHFWFRPKDFEAGLWSALRVRTWKGSMPTYDPDSFSLKHHSLAEIVHNSCIAELVHEVIILFSFVPILFTLLWGAFPVFLITSVLAALYDSTFVIMQRYNRPRLVRILEKKEAKCP